MLKTFFKKSIITLMLLTGVFMTFNGIALAQEVSEHSTTENTELDSKIKEVQKKLEEKNKNLKDLNSEFIIVKLDYKDAENSIEELNSEYTNLRDKAVEAKEPTPSNLEDLIKTKEEKLKTLNETEETTRTEKEKNEIKDLTSEISKLKQYKEVLTSLSQKYNIANLNDIESTIQSKLTEAKSTLETKQPEYNDLKKEIETLSTEIQELELKLAELNYEKEPNAANENILNQEKVDTFETKYTDEKHEELKNNIIKQCEESEDKDKDACSAAIDELAEFENQRKEAQNEYEIIQKNFQIQNSLKETTFDVTTNLNLTEDGGQDQNYFDDTKNDDSYSPLVRLILAIINYLTLIIATIAVILIIIAGFIFMIAAGDENTIEKGKDIIKYAIIGLVVTFFSYMIVMFVQSIFT